MNHLKQAFKMFILKNLKRPWFKNLVKYIATILTQKCKKKKNVLYLILLIKMLLICSEWRLAGHWCLHERRRTVSLWFGEGGGGNNGLCLLHVNNR